MKTIFLYGIGGPIDASPALTRSYMECIKKNSIESCMVFRDILERQGVEI